MTNFARLLATLLLSSPFALAQTPHPADGVYIQTGDHLDKLYVASTAGMKSSGAAKMMFSYGMASAKTNVLYRGETAPAKTTAARPEFHVVGPMVTAPRDVVIVRLQQKKDHRELEISKVNAYSGMKMQYPPSEVTEVDVKESGNERVITPKNDLAPGEYIIFTGSAVQMPSGYGGYDFTVAR